MYTGIGEVLTRIGGENSFKFTGMLPTIMVSSSGRKRTLGETGCKDLDRLIGNNF